MTVIGDKIRTRRTEKGISAAELARRVSISKGYLHGLETGDAQNPSAEILFRIASELGTTIADLLGESEPAPTANTQLVEIPKSLEKFAEKERLH
jgi:transcriptional regulator with XRE-family HTH domain